MSPAFVKALLVFVVMELSSGEFSKAIDASNTFAVKLFAAMPDSPTTTNKFFSPASINVALAKTLLGSRGETSAQLVKALSWTNSNQSEMHSMLHEFITKLGRRVLRKNKLTIASQMFVQEGIPLKQEFENATANIYLSKVGRVDFRKSDEARKQINLWVERGTDKVIKRLVASDIISPTTQLILVDGLYFRGTWRTKFDQGKTYNRNFFLSRKNIVKLKMMKTSGKFFWKNCSVLDSNVLELPYSGETISMVVILPNDIEGIGKVQEKFTYENYKNCFSGMMQEAVEVHFPRMRLREQYNMRAPLSIIGLENIFDEDNADLSGMTGKKGLFVSSFIHQANMRILERGTESPSGFFKKGKKGKETGKVKTREQVNRFIVNRPFLFTIQDKISGAILLFGKVSRPKISTVVKTESTQEKTVKKPANKESQQKTVKKPSKPQQKTVKKDIKKETSKSQQNTGKKAPKKETSKSEKKTVKKTDTGKNKKSSG